MSEIELPDRYDEVLATLKRHVGTARLRVQRADNTELIEVYWHIGRTVLEQQAVAGWGAKVVEQLAHDLRREFPDMRGLSRRNLLYMRTFAAAWPSAMANVPQPVAQLPWSHIRLLLDKLDTQEQRDWYAERVISEGWSRAALEHAIMGRLRERDAVATSNFSARLEERPALLRQERVRRALLARRGDRSARRLCLHVRDAAGERTSRASDADRIAHALDGIDGGEPRNADGRG